MPQLTLAQAFARAPTKKSAPEKPKPTVSHKPASKILFGPNGPHPNFDQFSSHLIAYNGVLYPSSQHLFQAFKFHGHHPHISEKIRSAATPQLASDIAHANKSFVRSDWFSINLSKMEEALFLKFSQHDQLKEELLSTDDAQLYQDSTTDSFWGVGSNLLGCNEFGRALERVRERLGGAASPVHAVLQCLKCGKKPRSGESLYCGTSCLRADISRVPPLCPKCRRRPQIGNLRFCGQTCLKAAVIG